MGYLVVIMLSLFFIFHIVSNVMSLSAPQMENWTVVGDCTALVFLLCAVIFVGIAFFEGDFIKIRDVIFDALPMLFLGVVNFVVHQALKK